MTCPQPKRERNVEWLLVGGRQLLKIEDAEGKRHTLTIGELAWTQCDIGSKWLGAEGRCLS